MAGLPIVAVSHAADLSVRATYLQQLSPLADVRFIADLQPAERLAVLRSAQVLATFSPTHELKGAESGSLAGLRFVQCLAAGRDRFPFAAFAGCGVAFNPGAAAEPIAEHAVAMILAAAKNLFTRHRQLADGVFNQSAFNTRLAGGTAAIVGLGAIGSRTGRLLQAFGMKIRAINSSGQTGHPVDMCRTLADLDVVLDGADVVVVAVELNRQTENLIGARQLQQLKSDAILVNVSRAAVIQQDALFAHLTAHPAFRACLDVWWAEPMHGGQFALEHSFLELPNVIGSPHNSAMVEGIFSDLARAAASNIARFMQGQTPHHLATGFPAIDLSINADKQSSS